MSEAAATSAVSCWMVRLALTGASLMTLPAMDELRPRMLGIDDHCSAVRYFRNADSDSWIRHRR
jgi:hypothetical protein